MKWEYLLQKLLQKSFIKECELDAGHMVISVVAGDGVVAGLHDLHDKDAVRLAFCAANVARELFGEGDLGWEGAAPTQRRA